MAKRIANYDDVGLSYSVVGTDVDWEHYYKDNKAIVFIAFELLKLPANYVLSKLGFLKVVKENFVSFINFSEKRFIETDQ